MYIHTYQVDNVLNVYRKQLSQKTKDKISDTSSSAPPPGDKVSLSDDGQRQSIIKQVSEDIIKRITGYSLQNGNGGAGDHDHATSDNLIKNSTQQNDFEFTYTKIDENNQKSTNSIHINGLSPTNSVGQQIREMEG